MNFNHYTEWKEEAERRGYTIETSGDNKIIAHINGDEKGWFDPVYAGSGFGELS